MLFHKGSSTRSFTVPVSAQCPKHLVSEGDTCTMDINGKHYDSWSLFGFLCILAVAAGAALGINALVNDLSNDNHVDVAREVTNVTYANAVGVPIARSALVVRINNATNATYAPPTCTVHGRNVFNPNNVSSSAGVDKGVSLSWRGLYGVDTVTLPRGMVHKVIYAGKTVRMQVVMTRIALYRDNTWDSIATSSPAVGQKTAVVNCYNGLKSGSQRLLVGLDHINVFVPGNLRGPSPVEAVLG